MYNGAMEISVFKITKQAAFSFIKFKIKTLFCITILGFFVFCPDFINTQTSLGGVQEIQHSFQFNDTLRKCEAGNTTRGCQYNSTMHDLEKIFLPAKGNKFFQLSNLLMNKLINKKNRIKKERFNAHDNNVNQNNFSEASFNFKQKISESMPVVNVTLGYESNRRYKRDQNIAVSDDSVQSFYAKLSKHPLKRRSKRVESNSTWNRNVKGSKKSRYVVTQVNRGGHDEKVIRQVIKKNVLYFEKFTNGLKRKIKNLVEREKEGWGVEDNILDDNDTMPKTMVHKMNQKNTEINEKSFPKINALTTGRSLSNINENDAYLNEERKMNHDIIHNEARHAIYRNTDIDDSDNQSVVSQAIKESSQAGVVQQVNVGGMVEENKDLRKRRAFDNGTNEGLEFLDELQILERKNSQFENPRKMYRTVYDTKFTNEKESELKSSDHINETKEIVGSVNVFLINNVSLNFLLSVINLQKPKEKLSSNNSYLLQTTNLGRKKRSSSKSDVLGFEEKYQKGTCNFINQVIERLDLIAQESKNDYSLPRKMKSENKLKELQDGIIEYSNVEADLEETKDINEVPYSSDNATEREINLRYILEKKTIFNYRHELAFVASPNNTVEKTFNKMSNLKKTHKTKSKKRLVCRYVENIEDIFSIIEDDDERLQFENVFLEKNHNSFNTDKGSSGIPPMYYVCLDDIHTESVIRNVKISRMTRARLLKLRLPSQLFPGAPLNINVDVNKTSLSICPKSNGCSKVVVLDFISDNVKVNKKILTVSPQWETITEVSQNLNCDLPKDTNETFSTMLPELNVSTEPANVTADTNETSSTMLPELNVSTEPANVTADTNETSSTMLPELNVSTEPANVTFDTNETSSTMLPELNVSTEPANVTADTNETSSTMLPELNVSTEPAN
ncbi:uncharacterized protein LOC128882213, partial [Hylaeus volcanicus]|uniref:uncharacterized protein LOC128882213 n=1 Tax=Hylaeus volcanicus TaxID=313075 RepID=UPI0023B7E2AE